MNIKDIIRARKSVRTFDENRSLTASDVEAIENAIKEANSPFGGKYTIEFKKFNLKGPQSPSTYGTISGASWYLLMGIHDDETSALSAGFAMEQVVLKATGLDLGTCWMALTFKGKDFMHDSDMPADQPLRIISPVGFPAKKKRIIESLTRFSLGSANRKPMDDLFSEGSFGQPVSKENPLYEPLEMMRLAPSAKNTQPWRALVQGDSVWFYYVDKSEASLLDLGIGLCHFYLTLKASGGDGTWSKAEDAPERKDYIPVMKFTIK